MFDYYTSLITTQTRDEITLGLLGMSAILVLVSLASLLWSLI